MLHWENLIETFENLIRAAATIIFQMTSEIEKERIAALQVIVAQRLPSTPRGNVAHR